MFNKFALFKKKIMQNKKTKEKLKLIKGFLSKLFFSSNVANVDTLSSVYINLFKSNRDFKSF